MNKLKEDELKNIFKNFDFERKNELIRFLCMFRKGEYLYPSVLKRNMKITDDVTSKIFDFMVNNGIAEKYYRYYCPNCCTEFGSFMKECEDNKDIHCYTCDNVTNEKHFSYKIV